VADSARKLEKMLDETARIELSRMIALPARHFPSNVGKHSRRSLPRGWTDLISARPRDGTQALPFFRISRALSFLLCRSVLEHSRPCVIIR
jgi:hypothetical protein